MPENPEKDSGAENKENIRILKHSGFHLFIIFS
jgi:hypothetical protein